MYGFCVFMGLRVAWVRCLGTRFESLRVFFRFGVLGVPVFRD